MNGQTKAAECAALQVLAQTRDPLNRGEAFGVRRIPPLLFEGPGSRSSSVHRPYTGPHRILDSP